jgi:hypothetical protein
MRQWLCQHRYTGLMVMMMVSQQSKRTGSADGHTYGEEAR